MRKHLFCSDRSVVARVKSIVDLLFLDFRHAVDALGSLAWRRLVNWLPRDNT